MEDKSLMKNWEDQVKESNDEIEKIAQMLASAEVMFIGARLFAPDDETIEETCAKFKAIELPVEKKENEDDSSH